MADKVFPGLQQRIAFLGAGNMAEALLRGLLKNGLANANQLRVTDVTAERRTYFEQTYAVAAGADNVEAVRQSDVTVLAVKPQVLGKVLREIRDAVGPQQLLISIAAGIPLTAIEGALPPESRVIRSMPNTPALVGRGMTAFCAGTRATSGDMDLAESILRAAGAVVRVTEDQMDAVTAVSGSGPAYVFYLMEAMHDAAERLGLPDEVARTLITTTVAGAAHLCGQSGEAPSLLRERVTSKGGTTAAALAVMDEEEVRDHLVTAIMTAYQRAQELSAEMEG